MKSRLCFALLALCLLAPSLQAQLKPGERMTPVSVHDQHEVPYTLEEGVEYLLVSFDMSTGKAANKYLEQKGAEFLPSNKTVYLSNIDGMPWVGRKFAFPKMRKYPHRILLADTSERELLAAFPQQTQQVTVFELDSELNIVSIKFWDPRSEPLSIGD